MGDAVALEDRVNIAEPLDGLFGRDDVDHAELAAVELTAFFFCLLDRRGEEILKPIHARAALGVGAAAVPVQGIPVGALVREGERLIEMEVVDNLVVVGRVQLWEGARAVPVVAAEQDAGVRCVLADTAMYVSGGVLRTLAITVLMMRFQVSESSLSLTSLRSSKTTRSCILPYRADSDSQIA